MNTIKEYFNNKYATSLLIILLIVDFLFIIGHVLNALLWDFSKEKFLVDSDDGYPEIFQYFKYLVIVIIIGYIILKRREYGYLVWFSLFFILLLDDAFQFHERVGNEIATRFNLKPAFGLRAIDFGELIYSTVVGGILFGLMAWPLYKGSATLRKTFFDIILLFSVFLFFGIGVDIIHELLIDIHMVSAVTALIEDGGEMISLSFIVWYFCFLMLKGITENTYNFIDFFVRGKRKESRT